MLENNFINQIRSSKGVSEELDLDVTDAGFRTEEGTYFLGPKEKDMVISAARANQYVFRYYWLKSASSSAEDDKFLKSSIDGEWIMTAYGELRITVDDGFGHDMTYWNIIEDPRLTSRIMNSITGISEDLDSDDMFDVVEDKGRIINGAFGKAYVMSISEKEKLVELMRELGPYGENGFKYPFGCADYMEDNISSIGNWIVMEYEPQFDSFWFNPFKGQQMHIPYEYMIRIIPKEAADELKEFYSNLTEDLDLDILGGECEELAMLIADRIGDCEVIGGDIYQLQQDFYLNDDEADDVEVEFGIFAIYEVRPSSITVWNSKADTCEEVNKIGREPLEYFKGTKVGEFRSLESFIEWLDDYFGRNWFGSYEDERKFVDDYSHLLEDIDLEVMDPKDDPYMSVLHGILSVNLNDSGKEYMSDLLEMDMPMDVVWTIVRDTPDIDYSYDDEDNSFPFALMVDGSFYDALSDSLASDIIYNHKDMYELE